LEEPGTRKVRLGLEIKDIEKPLSYQLMKLNTLSSFEIQGMMERMVESER